MKRLKIALVLVLLLVTIEFQSFCQVKGEIGDVNFTVRMTVTYSNKGTQTWNFTEAEQSVSLFMNNTWQNVQLLNHSYSPKSIKNDTDGNPTAVLQFKSQLTSGENLSYTVTYDVLSRPDSFPAYLKKNLKLSTRSPTN
ncbi:MAG: hypothetical protein OEY88_04885 [Candidatus Bathyarchaeota archaeon]|nr:hypothetical protein [Candidatus Bathyarchaeota archaeon]